MGRARSNSCGSQPLTAYRYRFPLIGDQRAQPVGQQSIGKGQCLLYYGDASGTGERFGGITPETTRGTNEQQTTVVAAALLPALQEHAPLVPAETQRTKRLGAAAARWPDRERAQAVHCGDQGRWAHAGVPFPAAAWAPPALQRVVWPKPLQRAIEERSDAERFVIAGWTTTIAVQTTIRDYDPQGQRKRHHDDEIHGEQQCHCPCSLSRFTVCHSRASSNKYTRKKNRTAGASNGARFSLGEQHLQPARPSVRPRQYRCGTALRTSCATHTHHHGRRKR